MLYILRCFGILLRESVEKQILLKKNDGLRGLRMFVGVALFYYVANALFCLV